MTITRRILLTASACLVFALILARAAGLQVGVATPDFTGINRNGQSVAL